MERKDSVEPVVIVHGVLTENTPGIKSALAAFGRAILAAGEGRTALEQGKETGKTGLKKQQKE